MITIRASELDQLRYFQQTEDMALPDLLGRLRGETPPSPAMAAGTAFHKILENPPDVLDVIERDGFRFIVEAEGELPLTQIRELRAHAHYLIDGEDVVLTGQVDGLHGRTVIDHKLTARPDPERYAVSMQWRCYLDLFKAVRFCYVLWGARDTPEGVVIRSCDVVPFYAYPRLHDDVLAALIEFVVFAREHLPERFQ